MLSICPSQLLMSFCETFSTFLHVYLQYGSFKHGISITSKSIYMVNIRLWDYLSLRMWMIVRCVMCSKPQQRKWTDKVLAVTSSRAKQKERSNSWVKPADFLVLGVQPVIKASDGHHDDAFPRHILEGSGNGDRPTLTDQIRIHVKN